MGKPFYEGKMTSRYERFGAGYRHFFEKYISGNFVLMVLTAIAGYILIMILGGILYCIFPRSTKGWVCVDCLRELNAEPGHIRKGNIIYPNPEWQDRRERGNIVHLHREDGECRKHGQALIPFEDSYNPMICCDSESSWFPDKFSFVLMEG